MRLVLATEAGVQLAKTVAIEEVTRWISREINDNALDGLEERVENSISKAAAAALEQNSILLTPNSNIEREQIARDVQNAAIKATKTRKFTQVTSDLAAGVSSAASCAGFGLGIAIHTVHKLGSVMDAGTKIEPILDDLKLEITGIINRAGAQAKQRLQNTSTGAHMMQSELDAFSKNIGAIVSSSVMNLIQRKVTTPIVNSGVSVLVNKLTEDYQYQQQQDLAKYREALGKAQGATSLQGTSPQAQVPKDNLKQSEIHQRAVNLTMQELKMAQKLSTESSSQFLDSLSRELQQPVYLFKDGKLVEAHGQDKAAKSKNPISLAYDSKSGKYVSLSSKAKDSHDSIYGALSSAQSKYAASALVKMHYALVAASKEVEKGKLSATGTGDAGKTSGQGTRGVPVNPPTSTDYSLSAMAQDKKSIGSTPVLQTAGNPKSVALTKEITKYLIELFGINTAEAGMAASVSLGGATFGALTGAAVQIKAAELAVEAGKAGAKALAPLAPGVALHGGSLWLACENGKKAMQAITTANEAIKRDPKLEHIPLTSYSISVASAMFPELEWDNKYDRIVLERAALGWQLQPQALKEPGLKPNNGGEALPQKQPIDFKVMGSVDAQKQSQNPNSLAYTVVGPNANKPKVLTTPLPERVNSDNITQDDSDKIRELIKLGGFEVSKDKPQVNEGFDRYEAKPEDSILYKKQYPDSVVKINNRYPINADLAGQKYPLPEALQALYPEGVWIKDNGCPDFTPYAIYEVTLEQSTGNRNLDEKLANKAAGLIKKPTEYTWHHVEDAKTMQLVPTKLHDSVKHTGGFSRTKEEK